MGGASTQAFSLHALTSWPRHFCLKREAGSSTFVDGLRNSIPTIPKVLNSKRYKIPAKKGLLSLIREVNKLPCMLHHFRRVWLFATSWAVTLQTPLSMGILQAKILEWAAMPSSRGSFQPRDRTPGLLHCRWILHRLSHQGSPTSAKPQKLWF